MDFLLTINNLTQQPYKNLFVKLQTGIFLPAKKLPIGGDSNQLEC